MKLDIGVAFRQTSRLNVHRDVLVRLGVSTTEDLPIGSLVHEQEFATEDAISTFKKVVLSV